MSEVKKSEAQLMDEYKAREVWNKKMDAAYDVWAIESGRIHQQRNKNLISEEDAFKLDAKNDAQKLNIRKVSDEELKKATAAIWKKHGWTQEKEDAADYAKMIEHYVEKLDDNVLGPWNRGQIMKRDVYDADRNVVFSLDGERIVSISNTGHVTGYNHVKPHGMEEHEKSASVKAVEEYIRGHTFKELQNQNTLELIANGAFETYLDTPVKLTAILLKNGKQALIATDEGAFEVVDVKSDAPLPAPTSSPVIAQAPSSGKGQGK